MPRTGRMPRRQVTLRLDPSLYNELASEAGRRKVPLIDYLRFCVERGHASEALAQQVGELRYLAEQVAGAASSAPSTAAPPRSAPAAAGSGITLPDVKQLLRTELGQVQKLLDNLSRQVAARPSAPAPVASAATPDLERERELLTSAFVSEELLRDRLAGSAPMSIRTAQDRARERVGKLLPRRP